MKLGNSKGNNRGKKYFLRSQINENSPRYEAQAQAFASWFAPNMRSLITDLKHKNNFDQDTFNDTYLRMHELILYTGKSVTDYRSYFVRSYFTNDIQTKMADARYCAYPDHDSFEELVGATSVQNIEQERCTLENDVMDFVFRNFSNQEFELFKMYTNLQPAITYRGLAEITNIKEYIIQNIVAKVKRALRANKELANRYYQIA